MARRLLSVALNLQKKLRRIVPALFQHGGKGERAGKPRGGFSKRCHAACEAAGKTESVYRRYGIVSDADLQEATRKLAAGMKPGISDGAGVDARPATMRKS